MIPEILVAGMLMDAGIEDVFVRRPGVMECPNPVTVGRARYERDERMADGERGTHRLSVHVCRDVDVEARTAAEACERALKYGSWEKYGDGCVVSVDARKHLRSRSAIPAGATCIRWRSRSSRTGISYRDGGICYRTL